MGELGAVFEGHPHRGGPHLFQPAYGFFVVLGFAAQDQIEGGALGVDVREVGEDFVRQRRERLGECVVEGRMPVQV